jgi:hypothetical protein
MLRHRRNRQSGFQLIDVMVGTTVLLFGFVGLIKAVTLGSEYLDTARKLQIANQIVTAEVERLRGGDWTTLTDLPANGSITVNSFGILSGDVTSFALANRTAVESDDNVPLSAAARGFKCAFVRTDLRPSAGPAVTFLKLEYVVSWASNTGRLKTHRATTYFSKNGLHLSFQQ